MKKNTLLALLIGIFNIATLSAQTIPPTGGGAASANPPASWTGPTSSTSNKTSYKGNAAQVWQNGPLAAAPGQVNTTFLSLYSNNNVISGAFTTVTGLTPGWTYEIKYDIMATNAKVGASFTDLAYTGEIGIFNNTGQGWGNSALTSKQYQFTAVNSFKWISGVFTFTAQSTTAILGFRALGQTVKGSIVNLNINPGAIKAVCGANPQVVLSKINLHNKCFTQYANLDDAFTGVVPQGWFLLWFDNNTHSGTPILFPSLVTMPGDYYAFFYKDNCYNTDISIAKVTVTIYPALPGDGQVMLNKSSLTNECPILSTVDLTKAYTSPLPAGAIVLWYDNPTHFGWPIQDPAHASVLVSKYYAFFYDSDNNCFNTDNSTAIVSITKRPCDQAAPVFEQEYASRLNPEFKSDIKLFPNPVADKIEIESVDLKSISQIEIYDMKGSIVYKSSGIATRSIDVKHLISGTYIVKISKKNGISSSHKILVSK